MGEQGKQGYDPAIVEEKWYRVWEEKGYFHADEHSSAPPYCIVIPPPNVTGSLHMGHALNDTLQDILIRLRRMQGYTTLWMPGTDHAGIATQNVVERQLQQEGRRREDLGREGFIARVWRWREESGGTIIRQLKRLGASCDWARERFTMDPGLSRAVIEVFVRLHEEGLLYRGDYIVNWCPRCQTVLSDIEIDREERDAELLYIRYGPLTLATVRPETKLGDTGLAVHPKDPRYAQYVGTTLEVPSVEGTITIKVVADAAVDPKFGTGVIKVTPGHDPVDFEIGRRHTLPMKQVIGFDARMTALAGKYAGLDRFECRTRIVEDLKALGLIEKIEPYRHAVGVCYRCRTVVEPLVSTQWYVRMTPLAEPALRAVEEGRVRIIPPQWEKTYAEWMHNIRDWCISRQIWWGHQIPAWYCLTCEKENIQRHEHASPTGEKGNTRLQGARGDYAISPDARPIVSREKPQACPRCGGRDLIQDPDVLDTWFSSALWPFSTLGWPERTRELEVFYPTSCLITGFDILFFWVARMIMMGLKVMGEVPFRDVYIHALVRDAEGQKMSKSKGNVIDPLMVIDKHGADSFRFTLAALAAQGRDVRLSEERIEGYRHFCNKMWNAYRFIEQRALPAEGGPSAAALPDRYSTLMLPDRWIVSRLTEVIQAVTETLESYRFNEAASTLYQFLWHEYCDWYLEIVKERLLVSKEERDREVGRLLLVYVLERALRLLHPLMPFITEEIWQRLPREAPAPSIVVAPWPEADSRLYDAGAMEAMQVLMEITRAVRNIRSEMNISPSVRVPLVVRTPEKTAEALLREGAPYLVSLARLTSLEYGPARSRPPASATAIVQGMELYLPLEGLIDFAGERGRLSRELSRAEKELTRVAQKLANADFIAKAPAEVVEKEQASRVELSTTCARLRENLQIVEEHLTGR